MEIPAAGFIESARDMMFTPEQNAKLLKELEAGAGRVVTDDFNAGYLIGLATARVLIVQGGWSRESVIADATAPPETPAAEPEMPEVEFPKS